MLHRRHVLSMTLGCLLILAVASCKRSNNAEFLQEVPWGISGKWLRLDTHTHTQFSDGAYSLNDLVDRASTAGCDVLAITDHGDLSSTATSPAYFEAIDKARLNHPNLILFAGMEWNIPPYGGREHVTLLVDKPFEKKLLPTFKYQFESEKATAPAALQWLAAKLERERAGVLIYNHPSRKDSDVLENLRDMQGWRAINRLFIGFEGAPGHQKNSTVGSYEGKLKPIERWDPVVAEIGGVWDTLLSQGEQVWGALASSDFHNDEMDYTPCTYSLTHIQVPERSQSGVLQALRAGSFWADHGHMLDRLSFILVAPGLPLPATPGEIIRVPANTPLQLRVLLQRGIGALNAPMTVDIIGNSRSGHPELLASQTLAAAQNTFDWSPGKMLVGADGKSSYFRVRVNTKDSTGKPLHAYTNPIRVILK